MLICSTDLHSIRDDQAPTSDCYNDSDGTFNLHDLPSYCMRKLFSTSEGFTDKSQDTYTATEYTGTIVTIFSAVATSTQIDTSTTTSTLTLVVTEFATPVGFKPVQSTLPGAGKKRDVQVAPISRIKRTLSSPLERRTFSICPALPKKGAKTSSSFTFLFPTSVTCYKVVTVYSVRYVTRTARTKATVTLPPGVVTSGVTEYETITTTVPNGKFLVKRKECGNLANLEQLQLPQPFI